MIYRDFVLDRFQQHAIELLEEKHSIIVSAPTGSGKTVIAEYAIEKSLRENMQVIYTSPIKALSNQKFRDFRQQYGDKVGIMTGDVTLNGEAPIIIMTTEIFRNALFENSRRFDSTLYLIFDEVHYLSDIERGSVWEESIIFAPTHIKILCLSATVPNVAELANWISQVRNDSVKIVYEHNRPVPLREFFYVPEDGIIDIARAQQQLPKKIKKNTADNKKSADGDSARRILDYLQKQQQTPCLYFVFSRKECEWQALQYARDSLLSSEQQKKLKNRLQEFAKHYQIPIATDDNALGSLLYCGIGYHHAGMVPAQKEMVEQLFTEGLIKVLFATETFALGVNMPATSVVFSRLKKYDGIAVRYLKALEYQQMSGRAGRRGLDAVGYVYADLSEYGLTRDELRRICHGSLESINSQFNLSYNSLLNIYDRLGEDVIKTCDKSFATFQRMVIAQKSGGKKKKRQISLQQRRLVKKKLAFLQMLGYIQDKQLTSKGRFAINISGYELETTEIFFGGYLENCDEIDLFVILVAIVFESKKGDRYSKVPKELRTITRKITRCIKNAITVEYMFDLQELKIPDFHLAAVTAAWAAGSSFNKLSEYSYISAGDLIRTFRLAIQLGRQLRKACEGYQEFVRLLDRCLLAVNRDEINALKQLEAFTHVQQKPVQKIE